MVGDQIETEKNMQNIASTQRKTTSEISINDLVNGLRLLNKKVATYYNEMYLAQLRLGENLSAEEREILKQSLSKLIENITETMAEAKKYFQVAKDLEATLSEDQNKIKELTELSEAFKLISFGKVIVGEKVIDLLLTTQKLKSTLETKSGATSFSEKIEQLAKSAMKNIANLSTKIDPTKITNELKTLATLTIGTTLITKEILSGIKTVLKNRGPRPLTAEELLEEETASRTPKIISKSVGIGKSRKVEVKKIKIHRYADESREYDGPYYVDLTDSEKSFIEILDDIDPSTLFFDPMYIAMKEKKKEEKKPELKIELIDIEDPEYKAKITNSMKDTIIILDKNYKFLEIDVKKFCKEQLSYGFFVEWGCNRTEKAKCTHFEEIKNIPRLSLKRIPKICLLTQFEAENIAKTLIYTSIAEIKKCTITKQKIDVNMEEWYLTIETGDNKLFKIYSEDTIGTFIKTYDKDFSFLQKKKEIMQKAVKKKSDTSTKSHA